MRGALRTELAILLTLLALTGCGTTQPTEHYLLTAEAQAATGEPMVQRIGVGPVEVAEYLHDIRLARSTGNRLELADFHRWAEPLDSGITRVLAENLALLTGGAEPVLFPWRGDERPPVAARVSVLKLERRNGSAELLSRWGLYNTDNDSRLGGELARLSTPLPTDANHSDAVAAYSELLLQLSQRIAEAIKTAR